MTPQTSYSPQYEAELGVSVQCCRITTNVLTYYQYLTLFFVCTLHVSDVFWTGRLAQAHVAV